MAFLKRFSNTRFGARSGDIILEEKDVPASIKKEREALNFSRDGFLDVSKSDLSVLSKSQSNQINKTSSINTSSLNSDTNNISNQSNESSGGMFDFLTGNLFNSSSSESSLNTSSSALSSEELSQIKKDMRNISSMSETNSNEIYRLLQRIELLERKIERLESKP